MFVCWLYAQAPEGAVSSAPRSLGPFYSDFAHLLYLFVHTGHHSFLLLRILPECHLQPSLPIPLMAAPPTIPVYFILLLVCMWVCVFAFLTDFFSPLFAFGDRVWPGWLTLKHTM